MEATTRVAGPAAGSGALPDVNAETYPYERVQQWLDETLSLSLCALPDARYESRATLTPDNADDYFGINGGYGLDFQSTLQRFEAVPSYSPDGGGFCVSQTAGDVVGSLHCRCVFAPSDAAWQPGSQPGPTLYDPWRSQRVATISCELRFGGDSFDAYAVGRTYPAVVDGKPYVLFGLVGNFMRGSGRFEGLEGTLVCAGQVMPSLGFAGSVTCRIVDPAQRIRTNREMPSMTAVWDTFDDQAFVVLRGVKRDRTVRTQYGPPPGGKAVSLITPSQMRTIVTEPVLRESAGLRVGSTSGPVIADAEADVSFDVTAPAGTPDHPLPFTTREVYTFSGPNGPSCGVVEAGVTDGISFGLTFPEAPGQNGVRFAGFGQITAGTGQFEGIQGLLTVNSVIGIAPHALSLLHVLHIVDPGRRMRSGRQPRRNREAASGGEPRLAPAFEPMLVQANKYVPRYLEWRRHVRTHAAGIACFASDWYERHLAVGEFPGLHIDPKELTRILEQPVGPFNATTFNRYGGPARGEFRQYDLRSKREISDERATLYSIWSRHNVLRDGRIIKQITGSFDDYFDPAHLPDLNAGRVDITLNSYRDDVGVTSWVEIFQRVRQQRTSFAYPLPHPHEVLWFVKDVSMCGAAVTNNVWMLSHEWKGERNGRTCYFMVGVFTEIDFETGEIHLAGNRFWRALYEESL